MREAPLLRKFKAWFLQKKAEVEKLFYPKIVRESMLKENSYQLKTGHEVRIQIGIDLDVEDIMEIQESSYGGKAPWGRLTVYNELNNRNSFFLMANYYGEGLAFIALTLRRGRIHITNVGTKPAFQRQGLASILIMSAAEIAKELELEIMTLEVRVSNIGAKRLYRKLGFKDCYIKKNYYTDNREDALEMSYQISKEDGLYND